MARYIDAEKLELEVRDGAIKLDGAWFFIGRSGKDLAHLVLAIKSVIQNAPAEEVEQVVHCCNCTIKKAVPHKDGIVWRCPHRTGDVKMEGYCESGARADGDLGRMGRN